VLEWVDKGADLSPIENCWAKLKDMVWREKKFLTTKEKIWEFVKDKAFSNEMTVFV
jgi:transposase